MKLELAYLRRLLHHEIPAQEFLRYVTSKMWRKQSKNVLFIFLETEAFQCPLLITLVP